MKKYLASLAMILLTMGAIPAAAQGQAPPPPGQEGPGQAGNDQSDQSAEAQPGVARVSLMNGDVSSQRGDNGDWVAVTLNTPISPDDRVATGEKARAEIQLDYANILRMSENATAKIATLSRTGIQVQIGQGLVTYTVLKGSEANPEIDTPNAAIHPNGPGEYRIQVNSDGETAVTVRDGSADVSTPQGSTHVDRGQMTTVQGTDSPEYKTESASGRDDWDSWNDEQSQNHQRPKLGQDQPVLHRLGRLGQLRHVERIPRLRSCVDSVARSRLGAVQRWPLGLGALLRLDLGWL